MHDDHASDPSGTEPPDGSASLGGRDLLTLGGMLVGCVVVGVVAGELLDRWHGTSPAFVLGGIALGVAAAGIGFWLRIRSFLRS